ADYDTENTYYRIVFHLEREQPAFLIEKTAGSETIGDALVASPAELPAAAPTLTQFTALSTEVAVGKDDRVHGREHTPAARGLAAGMAAARAGDRPLRIVVVGDSIFELFGGLSACDRLHRMRSAEALPVATWLTPTHGALGPALV